MASLNWQTIPEVVRAAKAVLPLSVWDYSCGGAETETTLRRNRSAFDTVAFRPRVLRNVGQRETSATFLGQRLSLPIMLAPVGSIERFHPDGALACARAAERVGTATFVSTMSAPSLQDVRAGADGQLIFQIYVRGGREWLEAFIRRIENAGYDAICLTVDSAVYGRRERDLRRRYLPREAHVRPNLADLPRPPAGDERDFQAALTWEDLDWVRSTTRLPVVLKGVLCAEDARIAADHGVDVVYVSNHGGRQLDHAPATLDVLPEIVEAVGGRAEVVVDGGFMHGTDVLKALCMGASSVLIGKLMSWALGAGGDVGIERTLEILRTEISTSMGNLGVTRLDELTPEFIRPSYAPQPAPWPAGPPESQD